MRIVVVIARVVLGLMFVFFGLNGFLNFLPAPTLTGVSGAFLGAMVSSHYVYLVCVVQVLGGLLLLVNQFLPLGVALLAPIIANIINYHFTMQRGGAQLAILATILWVFLAWKSRAYFAPLATRKAVLTSD
ncbi:MAG TPA: DoxX family membrane protein [Acidobacteriaceae bacterium]|nr:DoxX family membrane protein [Acidobacteriaceae bacterium]